MTLPIMLKKEISLHPPSVYVATSSFLTLQNTTIRAFRNHYRKWPNIKLIVAIFANIQYKGFPHILRNPISNRSFLRAFHTLSFRRMFAIYSLVTYYLIWTIPIQVSSLKSVSLISYRSAYSWGKNLSTSNITFSLYVHVVGATPIFSTKSSITTSSFGLQLQRHAHHSRAQIFFISSNTSLTKRHQQAHYTFLTAFDQFYYTSLSLLQVSYDSVILKL